MPRPAVAVALALTEEERTELERRLRARTSPQQAGLRARIVLLAAGGATNTAIAATRGITRFTARRWRTRFAAERLPGLADRPHRPLPRQYGPPLQARIVLLACQKPAALGWVGQAHWTIKDLAASIGEHPALGLGTPSKSTIHTILRAHDVSLDRL